MSLCPRLPQLNVFKAHPPHPVLSNYSLIHSIALSACCYSSSRFSIIYSICQSPALLPNSTQHNRYGGLTDDNEMEKVIFNHSPESTTYLQQLWQVLKPINIYSTHFIWLVNLKNCTVLQVHINKRGSLLDSFRTYSLFPPWVQTSV